MCHLYISCQCRLILLVHDGYCDVEAGSKSHLMSHNISVKFMKWASVFLFPLDITSATTAAWLMLNFASWYNFFQMFSSILIRFNQCQNRKWYKDGLEIEAEKLFLHIYFFHVNIFIFMQGQLSYQSFCQQYTDTKLQQWGSTSEKDNWSQSVLVCC